MERDRPQAGVCQGLWAISLAKARRTHGWHRLELLDKLLQRDLLAKASA